MVILESVMGFIRLRKRRVLIVNMKEIDSIKDSLLEFSEVSGQVLNHDKFELYF